MIHIEIRRKYYPSGNLKRETQFLNNLRNGYRRTYIDSESKLLKSEYYYENNILNGPYIIHLIKSNITGKGNYKSGKLDGLILYLYNDGCIFDKSYYLNGLMDNIKIQNIRNNNKNRYYFSMYENGEYLKNYMVLDIR